jgi:hypothetical protein
VSETLRAKAIEAVRSQFDYTPDYMSHCVTPANRFEATDEDEVVAYAVTLQERVLVLEGAIRDHISDGKHVGPRSQRLRDLVGEPPSDVTKTRVTSDPEAHMQVSADHKNDAPEIPEDLKTQCPLCKGTGVVEQVGFANAVQMDSGTAPGMVTKSCHLCHTKGYLLPSNEDLLAQVTRLRRQLAEANRYTKQMDQVIDDESVSRSCINPLEDLRLAIQGLKMGLAARDITITALRETIRNLNRRNQALEHAVTTQSEKGAWKKYFDAALRLVGEMDATITELRTQLEK